MIDHNDKPDEGGMVDGRLAVLRFGGLLLGLVLFGVLIAPLVAGALWAVGRGSESWDSLRNVPFERITARVVTVAVAIGMAAALARGWFGTRAQWGRTGHRIGRRMAGAAFALGVASVAVVVLLGLLSGAYRLNAPTGEAALAAMVLLGILAIVVSAFEEIVFRGVLYSRLRDAWGPLSAGLVSSLFFSLVHFAKPVPSVAVAHPHWYSGLALLPDMFRKVHVLAHYWPYALTLFLMGAFLCWSVQRTRSLYAAIGLHAGWIFGLGALREFGEGGDYSAWWFGPDADGARGWAAVVMIGALWLVSAGLSRGGNGKRKPET